MSVGPHGRAGSFDRVALWNGGPEGSTAMMPRTSFGLASASSQPNGPACECVTRIAGPIRSSSAVPAFCTSCCVSALLAR
jgi:hypothetical protein